MMNDEQKPHGGSAVYERMLACVRSATPSALKTIWWLVKIMVGVSFGIMLLQYFGVIGLISKWLTPLFSSFGLPGEAALAYVSGYFVNCYTAMAVMTTLNLNMRAATILAVMILCSHNMIVETTVQHKTGSSAVRIVVIRTLSAFIMAFVLNKIMPGEFESNITQITDTESITFISMLKGWTLRTLKTVGLMVVLVYALTLLQRILKEFGIIEYIAKFLKPVMVFFGLPPRTAFMWLIANTLGLAYGAAIMIDEASQGTTTKEENDLLNHHIGISHSNLEDLLLFTAIGGNFLWMLLSRWAMSLVLVWERRFEKKMKRLFFLIFAVLISAQIEANNNVLPDSLVVMLETNTKNDIKRVDALINTISFLFDENKIDESEKYVNELYQITRNLNDDRAKMLGEYYKGTFYTLRKDSNREAIQCLLTARNIVDKMDETDFVLEYKIRIYISLCANYINYQMFTEAYQCIEKANKWNEKLENEHLQYILDNNTLIIYSAMGKHSESIRKVKDFIVNNRSKSTKSLFNLYLNLASTYMELGEYDSAMMYLDTIKREVNSPYETALILSYEGCANNGLENYQTAVECFTQVLDIKKIKNTELEVYTLGHLSNSYFNLKAYDSAFFCVDKAIEISKNEKLLKWEVGTLEQKCDYLLDREMYKEYSENIVIYNKLNDSLTRVENLNELDKLFLQRQFTDVENQLKQEIIVNQIKHENQRMVMIFVIVAMFAVIMIVLLLLNRKNILLKSKKIKEDAMAKELEMRNRELASNVVILMKKNEVFADILNRLIVIKENAGNDGTKEAIMRVSKDLESVIETKFWNEFEVRFKNVHSDFYQRLMEKYPNLTTNEVRLCSFLKLDLSTKDISSITGQSVQSIEKARNRLRKKLGIGNDSSIILTSFVQKI